MEKGFSHHLSLDGHTEKALRLFVLPSDLTEEKYTSSRNPGILYLSGYLQNLIRTRNKAGMEIKAR